MEVHDENAQTSGAYWFAKYAALFVLPVAILIPFLYEHDGWFIGLASYWFLSVAFLAWRSMSAKVGVFWRVCLAASMVVSYAYSVAFVMAVPGETEVCYDRLSRTHFWGRWMNLGPSPFCEGTPLQDVQVD